LPGRHHQSIFQMSERVPVDKRGSMSNNRELDRSAAGEPSDERPATGAEASGLVAATNAQLSYADPLTEDQVRLALRKVKDPELNLNIIDLGLVYGIRVDGTRVAIDMTLTSPACPAGPQIMADAERAVKAMPGVAEVAVNLVWTPFWSPDLIEPRVRAYMGL
jgi:metal-sulfur cluster biosynthetic enzyme